jgi:uncharacterized membrane protein
MPTNITTCSLCSQQFPLNETSTGLLLRKAIQDLISADHPAWKAEMPVCFDCLNRYRTEFVQNSLEEQKGELSAIELEVIQSMKEQDLLSENLNETFQEKITFGQKLADHLASFGGSWIFMICFGVVLALWILINTSAIFSKNFDPYPFILLNLILSCLASIQAPIIMMSQNRQEARDRIRAESDYRVNLKAELEIRHLHLKLDQLMTHQWQRLLEIQQIQTDLIGELTKKLSN